jgi:acyl carrier protein
MKITSEELEMQIKTFIRENFIFTGKDLDAQTSLIGSGTIDSTGILEVIGFLEQTFAVVFDDDELVAENFDSVAKMQSFMLRKLAMSESTL